jgi:uncharacterized protein YcbK (DUF882 family)
MGNLSEHFSTWEFECGCGCGECCPSNELLEMLELTRVDYGRAIRISSGTRCAQHNEMVGGSENSSHVPSENALGQSLSFAVDVFVANSGDAYRLVDAAMQAGFDRIGFKLRSGFIHLDCDPQKSRPHMWGYPG